MELTNEQLELVFSTFGGVDVKLEGRINHNYNKNTNTLYIDSQTPRFQLMNEAYDTIKLQECHSIPTHLTINFMFTPAGEVSILNASECLVGLPNGSPQIISSDLGRVMKEVNSYTDAFRAGEIGYDVFRERVIERFLRTGIVCSALSSTFRYHLLNKHTTLKDEYKNELLYLAASFYKFEYLHLLIKTKDNKPAYVDLAGHPRNTQSLANGEDFYLLMNDNSFLPMRKLPKAQLCQCQGQGYFFLNTDGVRVDLDGFLKLGV